MQRRWHLWPGPFRYYNEISESPSVPLADPRCHSRSVPTPLSLPNGSYIWHLVTFGVRKIRELRGFVCVFIALFLVTISWEEDSRPSLTRTICLPLHRDLLDLSIHRTKRVCEPNERQCSRAQTQERRDLRTSSEYSLRQPIFWLRWLR